MNYAHCRPQPTAQCPKAGLCAVNNGRFVRFNPRTERWIEYMMPEPYSHNRRTWIDNSTTPVTVWYVDHNGYMVRIQPLE